MSRQSSGHFGKGHSGYFFHNDRSTETNNSIFSDEKNEYSCSAKEALQIYQKELLIRSQKYTEITGQKLQKNAITHRSLIINLEQHHTLQNLEEIRNYLEQELDTKVLQIAIHRDEGYINQKGKEKKNYHAHIELMGIDRYGISLAQHQNKKNSKTKVEQTRTSRLDSKFYAKFQTFLANSLGMQRGQRNSRKRRLDTYEYKEHKKREAKLLKPYKKTIEFLQGEARQYGVEIKSLEDAKQFIRDLQEQEQEPVKEPKESFIGKVLGVSKLKKEIQTLRNELKQKNAELEQKNKQKVYTQADYIALNALKKELNKSNLQEIYEAFKQLKQELRDKTTDNKKLREELLNKNVEISLLQEKLKSYPTPSPSSPDGDDQGDGNDEELEQKDKKIDELEKENEELKNLLEQLQDNYNQIHQKLIEIQEEIEQIKSENAKLKKENEQLKSENTKLEQTENTEQAKKKKKSKYQTRTR